MARRVHEIAKEHGLTAKELLAQLQAAGVEVKSASSNVADAVASRVLGAGAPAAPAAPSAPATAPKSAPATAAAPKAAAAPQAAAAKAQAAPPARAAEKPASPPEPAVQAAPEVTQSAGDGQADARARAEHKRPTRDSLQGERAPGTAGGRRRVVIDSQASRRAGGGTGPPAQPPRRQRRGRRRRGVYDEEAESRPQASLAALAERAAIAINSGSTVKDVAEYRDVAVPEVMKKLMALGEL